MRGLLLRTVCEKETNLEEEEIRRLEEVARMLPLMADLVRADVFIDCMDRDGVALVAAQAAPAGEEGLYQQDIVGQRAYAHREPAVYLAFATGLCRRDLKATTQEGRQVKQDVVPLRGEEGQVIGVLIAERDISGDLRQEKKFQELARSQESRNAAQLTMLPQQEAATIREIHHRVKNNLQLIASLLNMQARKAEDPMTKKILAENVNRVLSIAAIHDILTVSEHDNRRISSTELLEKLRRNLQSFAPPGKAIVLRVEGDELQLSADCATSVSLVVSELITNALEHAFPNRDGGMVRVLVQAGRLTHSISVMDDGVGFTPDQVREGSMGMEIVRATVEDKLKGSLQVSTGPGGTQVMFEFKGD